MKNSVYRKALKSKQKYINKFGDDSKSDYPVEIHKNEHIAICSASMTCGCPKGDRSREIKAKRST